MSSGTLPAEERWRTLAAHWPGHVLTIDGEDRITSLGKSTPLIDAERDLGRSLFDFVATEEHARLHRDLAAVRAGHVPVTRRVRAQVASDAFRWYDSKLLLLQDGGVMILARDVSEEDVAPKRELAEERHRLADAERSEQRLRALTKATLAFSNADRSPERLLEGVVRELAESLQCGCAVLQLTEDGQHFTTTHVHAADLTRLPAFRARLTAGEPRRVETHPGLRHVVETGTPLFLPDVKLEMAKLGSEPFADKDGMSSSLMVPLTVRGRIHGAIGVVRYGAGSAALDEQDLALVQSLAEHTALALAAAQLLEESGRELLEREKMAARLRLLAEASHEFADATDDYHRLLAVVARRLATVVGDLCSVRAVSEDGKTLERGAVHHRDAEVAAWAETLLNRPQRVGEGVAGKVAESGQAIFLPKVSTADYLATALPHYRELLERLAVGSAISVPLSCRGQILGVVGLVRSGCDNPYTEDDLRLVQSVADRAALAIGNARSYWAERVARAQALDANATLQQSESAHRLLFESSPVPVVAFSIDTLEILAANAAALRLYGYGHDEMLAMTIVDLRASPDEADVRATLVAGGHGELAGTVRHRRKDGSSFFAEYHSHALSLGGRRARITVMTDVTASHEAEQTRLLLGAIVQSSNDAIVSKRLDGTITSWNAAAERLFGYASEEAVGQAIGMLIPENLLGEETELLAAIANGDRVEHYETVRKRKDGSLVHVSISLAPILDATGKVVGASKTARDLTAQREAAEVLRKTEEQLRQSQKMDAVGRLAGGIAHDFNNALSVILGCSGLVLNDLKPDDPIREDLDEVRMAALRASELTRQLLLFSRQQVIAPRVLDLNGVLAGMDKMVRRILGEDIDLVTAATPGLGRILADPGNLDQVVMNLVVNARDAMPTGGKLTIETANVELDAEYAREHLGVVPGPHVMLAVSDTGCGMDQATQARIFEPFFSTKEAGKGTGLGLSTVFGIARQASGSVWVYSELGRGTTFKVYFPRVEGELDVVKPMSVATPRRCTETILLVEDQDQVRAVALAILSRSGYRVLVAGVAGEALLLCEQHQGPIDLLVTDVVMPQLSGVELAKQISAMRPGIKVLYMSGYTDDSIVRHGVLESEMAFLQKPFTPESLAGRVREVIDGGQSTVSLA